jgi:hypothetical protein
MMVHETRPSKRPLCAAQAAAVDFLGLISHAASANSTMTLEMAQP